MSTHNMIFGEIKISGAMSKRRKILGPVVQRVVSLTSSLLTTVTKVFSNTLIFLL